MKLLKVHRVVAFAQKPWLKSNIKLNSTLRQAAKSEFEKDFFKLTNNAYYFGKSMENVINGRTIEIVGDSKKSEEIDSEKSNWTVFDYWRRQDVCR